MPPTDSTVTWSAKISLVVLPSKVGLAGPSNSGNQ
nr:MAG TPA: hypothetical protein [Caudoviricetes sp.]